MPGNKQPNDPYAEVAEWYDLEHDGLTDDLECYSELLGPPAVGKTALLEVGSGSGRVAAALAAAGYEVTGIEPSGAMRRRAEARLAQLPERVARRIHVVAGTADDYGSAQDRLVHAVLFGLNTFSHLSSASQRRQALLTAWHHLQPGGRLLVDLDLAGTRRLLYSAGQLYLQGVWKVPDSPSSVSHLLAASSGPEAGTLLVTHFYDVSSAGGEVRRTISQMALGIVSAGELELAAAAAGFATLALYGDFDLTPYDDLSERAILLAERPDGALGPW